MLLLFNTDTIKEPAMNSIWREFSKLFIMETCTAVTVLLLDYSAFIACEIHPILNLMII